MLPHARGPVLIAYRSEMMRRILRLNLESEGFATVDAASAGECVARIRRGRIALVVLDPEIFADDAEEAAVCAALRGRGLPVLLVSAEPDSRRLSPPLGGAPFCNRPDDIDRVTEAVRTLIGGCGLPALV